MPRGSQRPYTKKQRMDVKTVKKANAAKKAGMNELPGGYAEAAARRKRDTGKRPKKRPALKAATTRVKRAMDKGRKVKYKRW